MGKMYSVMWVNTVWMLHTTFTDDPNTKELKEICSMCMTILVNGKYVDIVCTD